MDLNTYLRSLPLALDAETLLHCEHRAHRGSKGIKIGATTTVAGNTVAMILHVVEGRRNDPICYPCWERHVGGKAEAFADYVIRAFGKERGNVPVTDVLDVPYVGSSRPVSAAPADGERRQDARPAPATARPDRSVGARPASARPARPDVGGSKRPAQIASAPVVTPRAVVPHAPAIQAEPARETSRTERPARDAREPKVVAAARVVVPHAEPAKTEDPMARPAAVTAKATTSSRPPRSGRSVGARPVVAAEPRHESSRRERHTNWTPPAPPPARVAPKATATVRDVAGSLASFTPKFANAEAAQAAKERALEERLSAGYVRVSAASAYSFKPWPTVKVGMEKGKPVLAINRAYDGMDRPQALAAIGNTLFAEARISTDPVVMRDKERKALLAERLRLIREEKYSYGRGPIKLGDAHGRRAAYVGGEYVELPAEVPGLWFQSPGLKPWMSEEPKAEESGDVDFPTWWRKTYGLKLGWLVTRVLAYDTQFGLIEEFSAEEILGTEPPEKADLSEAAAYEFYRMAVEALRHASREWDFSRAHATEVEAVDPAETGTDNASDANPLLASGAPAEA